MYAKYQPAWFPDYKVASRKKISYPDFCDPSVEIWKKLLSRFVFFTHFLSKPHALPAIISHCPKMNVRQISAGMVCWVTSTGAKKNLISNLDHKITGHKVCPQIGFFPFDSELHGLIPFDQNAVAPSHEGSEPWKQKVVTLLKRAARISNPSRLISELKLVDKQSRQQLGNWNTKCSLRWWRLVICSSNTEICCLNKKFWPMKKPKMLFAKIPRFENVFVNMLPYLTLMAHHATDMSNRIPQALFTGSIVYIRCNCSELWDFQKSVFFWCGENCSAKNKLHRKHKFARIQSLVCSRRYRYHHTQRVWAQSVEKTPRYEWSKNQNKKFP